MEILIPDNFGVGYWDNFSGSASQIISSTGTLVKLTSPLGINNGAMKNWYFQINAGDEVEFEVFARCISGEVSISFDLYETDGTFTSAFYKEVVSGDELKIYRGKFKVPYGKSYDSCGFVMGITNAVETLSEGEFLIPRIKVNNNGTLQTIACGQVNVVNGVASLSIDAKRSGIESVSYNDTTKKVTLILSKYVRYRFWPLVFATSHIDHPTLHPVVGTWDGTNQSVSVGLADGTGLKSLSSGTYRFFVEVKA